MVLIPTSTGGPCRPLVFLSTPAKTRRSLSLFPPFSAVFEVSPSQTMAPEGPPSRSVAGARGLEAKIRDTVQALRAELRAFKGDGGGGGPPVSPRHVKGSWLGPISRAPLQERGLQVCRAWPWHSLPRPGTASLAQFL